MVISVMAGPRTVRACPTMSRGSDDDLARLLRRHDGAGKRGRGPWRFGRSAGGRTRVHFASARFGPRLKRRATIRGVQARMLPAVAFISAFLNNTPLVVIFAPMIKRWAERHRLSPTKFLIPLSYATILGGVYAHRNKHKPRCPRP